MLSPQRVHPRYHAKPMIHAHEDVITSALSQKIIFAELVKHDDLVAINLCGAINITPLASE
jgi:hypothetical protein